MSASSANHEDLVSLAQTMLSTGAELEEVLDALRACMPSPIAAMKVVRDVLRIPMDEAKQLVHFSRTWSDMRDEHAELHERAEASFTGDLRREEDGSYSVDVHLRRKE